MGKSGFGRSSYEEFLQNYFFRKVQMIPNIFHIYHIFSKRILFDVQLIEVARKITIFGQNASKSFSNIAVTVIRCLLPIITQEFEENHGQIHDGKYAIVGLGTLGSREMIFSSDLDLIFIYDSSEKNKD